MVRWVQLLDLVWCNATKRSLVHNSATGTARFHEILQRAGICPVPCDSKGFIKALTRNVIAPPLAVKLGLHSSTSCAGKSNQPFVCLSSLTLHACPAVGCS